MMDLQYRPGRPEDVDKLKCLAIKSWHQYQSQLTKENWDKLYSGLTEDKTYTELFDTSKCILCTSGDKILGMAFLVPKGNPTEIYDKTWSYIRFVSVDPDFAGKGIGRKLIIMCIEAARKNGEKIITLHTSELMDKARHIYETLGFTVLKEIDPRYGKRYWLYKLDL